MGEENWSCLGEDRKGKTPRCKQVEEERLCPRALARLRRVAATVEFRDQEIRIERDTAFDTAVFSSMIKFDADPLKPISLTVSALKTGVELRAGPLLERMEAYSLERAGIALPPVAPLQVGESVQLPARIYAGDRAGDCSRDCAAEISVRSHYARRDSPLPARGEREAVVKGLLSEALQQSQQLVEPR